MRIPSGVTDQVIYFVAQSGGSRVTGLTGFTVYRARNGGAAAAMTTPTVTEVDATNMPGVYTLLLDEDMTLDAGDASQEMAFHISATGMDDVTRTIELFRPPVSAGETLTVSSGALPWNAAWDAEVQSEVTDALNAYDPPTNAEMEARTLVAANYATASALSTVDGNVDAILVDTGTTLPGLIGTPSVDLSSDIAANLSAINGLNDISPAQVNAEVDTALADYDSPTNAEFEARTLTSAQATKQGAALDAIVTGTVNDANTTPTTTVFAANDITEATADHFIGRNIYFTSGALDGQATDITDYELASGEGKFTVTALTEAPADTDTFVIV